MLLHILMLELLMKHCRETIIHVSSYTCMCTIYEPVQASLSSTLRKGYIQTAFLGFKLVDFRKNIPFTYAMKNPMSKLTCLP